jgi:Rod binding domain-containing protein
MSFTPVTGLSDQPFRVGALPPGTKAPTSAHDKQLYRAALDFEGSFTQHLVDDMMQSAQGDDSDAGGSQIYQEMVNETLNDALVNGGGLGLAGTIYASLKQAGR